MTSPVRTWPVLSKVNFRRFSWIGGAKILVNFILFNIILVFIFIKHLLILCIINEINCLKKLIDIFNIQFQKKRSKTKTNFLRYFQTWESEGEIFVVILKKWKSEKPILTWSRRDAKVKKIKKSEKVKKVKKSEKVKPKVNHFLKASETPKCTFPSPLINPLMIPLLAFIYTIFIGFQSFYKT